MVITEPVYSGFPPTAISALFFVRVIFQGDLAIRGFRYRFTALVFGHINNNPFDTCFIFLLPPGKTNRLHTSETQPQHNPNKAGRDICRSKKQKTKKPDYEAGNERPLVAENVWSSVPKPLCSRQFVFAYYLFLQVKGFHHIGRSKFVAFADNIRVTSLPGVHKVEMLRGPESGMYLIWILDKFVAFFQVQRQWEMPARHRNSP